MVLGPSWYIDKDSLIDLIVDWWVAIEMIHGYVHFATTLRFMGVYPLPNIFFRAISVREFCSKPLLGLENIDVCVSSGLSSMIYQAKRQFKAWPGVTNVSLLVHRCCAIY